MGVVANNPIQELLPAAARHVNNSVTPIRIVGLEEARSIEQFVPVIVLLPASANGQANSIRQTGNNSVSGTSTASAIFELFGRGGKLPSLTNAESELVFGDVKVNFSSMRGMVFPTARYVRMRQNIADYTVSMRQAPYKRCQFGRSTQHPSNRLLLSLRKEPSPTL